MSTSARSGGVQSLPPSEVYSLKWNNFATHLATGLRKLLDEEDFTDVTLATSDGHVIRAHKFLLSLCSPYFKKLFKINPNGRKTGDDTIVILSNTKFKDLENILRFIYNGEAKVHNADLQNFLQTGDLLQIEGLAGLGCDQDSKEPENLASPKSSRDAPLSVPPTSAVETTQTTSAAVQSRRRPVPVGNGQHKTCASIQNKNSRVISALPPRKAVVRLARLDPKLQRNSFSTVANEDVDPLEIVDSNMEDTSMLDNSINDDQEETEPLVNVNDLKTEQFQYYSSKTADEQPMVFDESVTVFDGYEHEGGQTEPGKTNIPSARSVQNNASHSRPRPKVARLAVAKRPAILKKKSKKGRNKYARCPYCNAEIYRSNLSRHMATVHTKLLLAEGKRLFRCSICKMTYRTLNHLQIHMQKHEAGI